MATMDGAVRKNVFVSLDIEGVGAAFDAPIAAIGCYVATQDESGEWHKQAKRCWCIRLDESAIEPQCKTEFWDKQDGLWKRIQAEADVEANVAKSFIAFWNNLEHAYPESTHKLTILSDNPSYDIGCLDYFVWKNAKRLPLRYTSSHQYRAINDPSEQAKSTNDDEGCWERAKAKCPHNHWPADDAEAIFHWQIEVLKLRYVPKEPATKTSTKRAREEEDASNSEKSAKTD